MFTVTIILIMPMKFIIFFFLRMLKFVDNQDSEESRRIVFVLCYGIFPCNYHGKANCSRHFKITCLNTDLFQRL